MQSLTALAFALSLGLAQAQSPSIVDVTFSGSGCNSDAADWSGEDGQGAAFLNSNAWAALGTSEESSVSCSMAVTFDSTPVDTTIVPESLGFNILASVDLGVEVRAVLEAYWTSTHVLPDGETLGPGAENLMEAAWTSPDLPNNGSPIRVEFADRLASNTSSGCFDDALSVFPGAVLNIDWTVELSSDDPEAKGFAEVDTMFLVTNLADCPLLDNPEKKRRAAVDA